jgi:peptide/nickel transport system permease protein
MLYAPWMAIWPGLALSLAIYGINMLGDGVRDILDPRLRGGLVRYGSAKVKKQSPNVNRE